MRALQREPFNRSLDDILQMTVPMARNLFRNADEPRGSPSPSLPPASMPPAIAALLSSLPPA